MTSASVYFQVQLLSQQDVMAHITINQYLQQVSSDPSCTRDRRSQHSSSFFFVGVSLLQVYEAIDNHEGSFCSELLSFKHPHVANPRLQVRPRPLWDIHSQLLGYGLTCVCVCVFQLAAPEDKCQQVLEPPYDEMVAAHLRLDGQLINAFIID